jgi:predicted nucleotidyltransferase
MKLERLLKEKEKDYKDSVELRVREVQQRYEAELDKLNDQYSKLENDTYKKAQSIKLMEIERH